MYSILIALSRIITGMHSLVDVAGGALIGGGLVLVHWWWIMRAMEEWLMSSWTGKRRYRFPRPSQSSYG